jgi:O-methyltransferase
VDETIPKVLPREVAVLRLDSDWYESTRHELVHLFPLLKPGGVLIIDDYGHWQGARMAVDEYLQEQGIKPLLSRIDFTCRMMIK